MTDPIWLFAPILAALAGALAAGLAPNGRLAGIGVCVGLTLALAAALVALDLPQGTKALVAQPLPGLAVALWAEPNGRAFAVYAALLGLAHAIFAVGYAQSVAEPSSRRLFAFIGLTLAAAFAMALSANLFTFFLSYAALILASFPLAGHDARDAGLDPRPQPGAGLAHLALLLGPAMGLLLPAMIWIYALAGSLDFEREGLLAGRMDADAAAPIVAMCGFGVAAAGLMPLHRWLTLARNAAAPAAAMLQTIVAAAGAFGLLKIASFVFGAELIAAAWGAKLILGAALLTTLFATLIALGRRDLTGRLAYSSVAGQGLVVAAIMLGGPAGAFAGLVALMAHGFAKTTLILAGGGVRIALGRSPSTLLAGIGRLMPWTFAAIAFAGLSLVGFAPLAGAWSQLWLAAGAAEAAAPWAAFALPALSALTLALFAPMAAQALFAPAPKDLVVRPDAASLSVAAPIAAAAALTLLLLPALEPLARFVGVDAGAILDAGAAGGG
jgi:multicomponent Na+:H+ antiporter subunit D